MTSSKNTAGPGRSSNEMSSILDDNTDVNINTDNWWKKIQSDSVAPVSFAESANQENITESFDLAKDAYLPESCKTLPIIADENDSPSLATPDITRNLDMRKRTLFKKPVEPLRENGANITAAPSIFIEDSIGDIDDLSILPPKLKKKMFKSKRRSNEFLNIADTTKRMSNVTNLSIQVSDQDELVSPVPPSRKTFFKSKKSNVEYNCITETTQRNSNDNHSNSDVSELTIPTQPARKTFFKSKISADYTDIAEVTKYNENESVARLSSNINGVTDSTRRDSQEIIADYRDIAETTKHNENESVAQLSSNIDAVTDKTQHNSQENLSNSEFAIPAQTARKTFFKSTKISADYTDIAETTKHIENESVARLSSTIDGVTDKTLRNSQENHSNSEFTIPVQTARKTFFKSTKISANYTDIAEVTKHNDNESIARLSLNIDSVTNKTQRNSQENHSNSEFTIPVQTARKTFFKSTKISADYTDIAEVTKHNENESIARLSLNIDGVTDKTQRNSQENHSNSEFTIPVQTARKTFFKSTKISADYTDIAEVTKHNENESIARLSLNIDGVTDKTQRNSQENHSNSEFTIPVQTARKTFFKSTKISADYTDIAEVTKHNENESIARLSLNIDGVTDKTQRNSQENHSNSEFTIPVQTARKTFFKSTKISADYTDIAEVTKHNENESVARLSLNIDGVTDKTQRNSQENHSNSEFTIPVQTVRKTYFKSTKISADYTDIAESTKHTENESVARHTSNTEESSPPNRIKSLFRQKKTSDHFKDIMESMQSSTVDKKAEQSSVNDPLTPEEKQNKIFGHNNKGETDFYKAVVASDTITQNGVTVETSIEKKLLFTQRQTAKASFIIDGGSVFVQNKDSTIGAIADIPAKKNIFGGRGNNSVFIHQYEAAISDTSNSGEGSVYEQRTPQFQKGSRASSRVSDFAHWQMLPSSTMIEFAGRQSMAETPTSSPNNRSREIMRKVSSYRNNQSLENTSTPLHASMTPKISATYSHTIQENEKKTENLTQGAIDRLCEEQFQSTRTNPPVRHSSIRRENLAGNVIEESKEVAADVDEIVDPNVDEIVPPILFDFDETLSNMPPLSQSKIEQAFVIKCQKMVAYPPVRHSIAPTTFKEDSAMNESRDMTLKANPFNDSILNDDDSDNNKSEGIDEDNLIETENAENQNLRVTNEKLNNAEVESIKIGLIENDMENVSHESKRDNLKEVTIELEDLIQEEPKFDKDKSNAAGVQLKAAEEGLVAADEELEAAEEEPEVCQDEPEESKEEPEASEVEPEASEVEPEASEVEPEASEVEPEESEVEPEESEVEKEESEVEPEASEEEPEASDEEMEASEEEPEMTVEEPEVLEEESEISDDEPPPVEEIDDRKEEYINRESITDERDIAEVEIENDISAKSVSNHKLEVSGKCHKSEKNILSGKTSSKASSETYDNSERDVAEIEMTAKSNVGVSEKPDKNDPSIQMENNIVRPNQSNSLSSRTIQSRKSPEENQSSSKVINNTDILDIENEMTARKHDLSATPDKTEQNIQMKSSKTRTSGIDSIVSSRAFQSRASSTVIEFDDERPRRNVIHCNRNLIRDREDIDCYLENMKRENADRNREAEAAVAAMFNRRGDFSSNFAFMHPFAKTAEKKNAKRKIETKAPIVIGGHVYKKPKLYKPGVWATKQLYGYLRSKLERKYGSNATVRSVEFVKALHNVISIVMKDKDRPLSAVSLELMEALKREMARLDIITTHFDFYGFVEDFMTREFRYMAIPNMLNGIPVPEEGIYQPILQVE